MHSSMIGKIAKARQYAQEPERLQFTQFQAAFKGENDVHTISYDNGSWHCGCHFFEDHGTCCHTMAAERMFAPMLPDDQHHSIPQPLTYIGAQH